MAPAYSTLGSRAAASADNRGWRLAAVTGPGVARQRRGAGPQHAAQGQRAQNGHGQLRNNQRHAHGPELVVARQQVENQVVERLEVLAPGQQNGQHRARQQPVARALLHHKQAQNKQKAHHRAHVHRPGRVALLAPVGGHRAQVLLRQAGFGQVRIGAERHGAGAAVEVGNQQGNGFAHAVAVLKSIVAVHARAFVFGLGGRPGRGGGRRRFQLAAGRGCCICCIRTWCRGGRSSRPRPAPRPAPAAPCASENSGRRPARAAATSSMMPKMATSSSR